MKSGSTLQSLTALRVGEAEFYAVVKGGQVGLSLRSINQDREIPMKVEIQSDSSWERNTLTRGTFVYKNEFKTETSVSRKCLQRRTAQMLERSQSLLQYYNNIASLQDWFSADRGSHTPPQDDGDEPMMDLVTGLRRHEHRPKEESTRKSVAQKETIVSVDRERRDGCAKLCETNGRWTSLALLTMNGSWQEAKQWQEGKAMARCNAKFCQH